MTDFNQQEKMDKLYQDKQELKKFIRQLKRQKASGGLGMNSLMDIMTILLIFLLKSFSSKADTVQMSEELQLPKSTGFAKLEQTIRIFVTANNIKVEGDKKARTVSLTDSKIEDSDMLNGDPNTHTIATLKEILEEKAEYLQDLERESSGRRKFKGLITVISDKRIPYRIINDVVHTATGAKFKKIKFAIIQGS